MTALSTRIESKFRRLENGCWEWTSWRIKNGYGRIQLKDGPKLAHRVVYELLVGRVPPGLTLDHLCRNRLCVNPEHLQPVTMRENVLRGVGPTAINARKVNCIHGHKITGMTKRGHRYCVTCVRARNTGLPVGRKPQTNCSKGHPLIHYGSQGRKFCRECHSERARNRRMHA